MNEIDRILKQLGLLTECQAKWKQWQSDHQESRFFITKITKCYCQVIDDEIKRLKVNRVMGKEYIENRVSDLKRVKDMLFDLCNDPDVRNPDIE